MMEITVTPLIDVMLVLLTFSIMLPVQTRAVSRVPLGSGFPGARRQGARPGAHLNPNKLAKYGIIAKVLAYVGTLV